MTIGSDGRVVPWEPPYDNHKEIARFDTGVTSAGWSPDGKQIVVARKKHAPVVLTLNGEETLTIGNNPAYWVRFSPDCKRIATTENVLMRIWDAKTGENLLTD